MGKFAIKSKNLKNPLKFKSSKFKKSVEQSGHPQIHEIQEKIKF